MHTLQWIAVKNMDGDLEPDEILDDVVSTLEHFLEGNLENGSAWFDWFVVGGGRWNENVTDAYIEDTSMIIVDNLMMKIKVQECIAGRIEEFQSYRKGLNVDLNAIFDKFDGMTQYDSALWDLKALISMAQGFWDYNSNFFDAHNDTTNPTSFLKALDNGEKNWYLVPVDFHF